VCRPVFVCTKGGTICYVTLEWDDAVRYKAAFGCTLWNGIVGGFQQLDVESQNYLQRVAERSTPKAIRRYLKTRTVAGE
jgi:hypothetical protein